MSLDLGDNVDISGLLKEAWSEVVKAGLPENVQVAAFGIAAQLLSDRDGIETSEERQEISPGVKGIKPAQKLVRKPKIATENLIADSGSRDRTEDEMLDLIVEHTGVDRHKLERLVQLHGSEPRLTQSAIKGGLSSALYARSIALVLTVVRDAGLDEKLTPWSIIRAECSRLKKLEETNFGKNMARVKGTLVKGDNSARALKASPAAFTNFPSVVDTLLGIQETE